MPSGSQCAFGSGGQPLRKPVCPSGVVLAGFLCMCGCLGVCSRLFYRCFPGRWGTLMPYNVRLNVVVGEPVRVTARPNPTDEEVAVVLATYKLHLQRLFEEHKERCGYGGKQLIIV
eukprot:TRINITY_DN22186_c0_g1_i1.p2 TRINITY_DN22186_c0_g1~~TRINITY_DN22186_c0_g1_i1.p2  ORF type:complete len:116 (+),score=13.18 TRINITY_DN22186_c0_g1_i1:242-589(+)